MNSSAGLRSALAVLGYALVFATSAWPQDRKLTVEWMFGQDAHAATALPTFSWLHDGTALIYDYARPPGERPLERLNPRSGKRATVLSASRALTALRAVVGEMIPDSLPWPSASDAYGRYAIYDFGGDLYLVELKAARVRRLTNTDSSEKEPRFSPDGNLLAYVRDNDLYAYDIASDRETRLTEDGSETH